MSNNLIIEYSADSFKYYLHQFWRDFGDRRVKTLPMFSDGPYILFAILIMYLLLVMKIIPNLMKHREPLKLQSLIRCYNVFLVTINAYFFTFELRSLNYGIRLLDLSIPSDGENSPELQYESELMYFYHITKLIDLLDTIFFALRKKTNQISFLHLYHHTYMAFLSWLGFWYRFNMKPNHLFILLNSFVHVIMYSYYALSTVGPKIQKYLWWKKYLTQLQLIQFVIFAVYGIIVEILDIPYPKPLKRMGQAQCFIFLYLFYKFYVKSYKSKANKNH